MDTPDVKTMARQAGDSKPIEWGARLGYAVNGLLHLLIAWIALKVAWSSGGGGSPNQSGALATLAHTPGGPLLLWVTVAGFVLLAVWQLTEAISGASSGADRVKAAGKLVVYGVLAWTALKFATGGSTSSSGRTEDFTAIAMRHSGGRLVVAVLGLAVVGVGGYHVYKGWRKKFVKDLQEHPGNSVIQAGRTGYVAKGVALVAVGFLFLVAAIRRAPSKATGLDGGLRTLREAPAGAVLLSLVALGIAAYGIYSFARSRYARV
ncbi:DUF1206 domain-containing protein [Leekyejoonella antrihumi]|uniref:DUF1206 domain-containing protein n=1 Tax=Leekyejoonella antrihumi TaxID=1660198 RepID=A0A563DVS6_9MICO|nr:DUF1206 domain-containing protein [Leekyejoonella antrihumi]TWP34229.1 DUF1206 domain-containing protein [Leekyejoonella antrihumi]